MAAWVLIGFLSFLFIMDGTVLQWLVPQAWGSNIVFISRLMVSGIIMLSLFQGRRSGLAYGFCFGLLYDMVYGQAIGVFAFTTACIGYISGLISRQFISGPIIALLATGISQSIHLIMSYGWLRLFDITLIGWLESLVYHIIPSVIFNTVIAFPVYLGIKWILKRFAPDSVPMFQSKWR